MIFTYICYNDLEHFYGGIFMSKARKPANKKKILKGILIFLAIFIVLNLLGAAIGTAVSITHPKRYTYDDEITRLKDDECWGNFDAYDKTPYTVLGLDNYELHCMKVSTAETEGTGRYVIISHGLHSTMYSGAKYCDAYIELGFTCIIYDLRAHGANDKAICSMGGYEGQDLNFIIEDTFARYGDVEVLGLQGESMGTSASLNSLRYTDKVDFVVADCGFESLKFMLHDMYNDMYMYPFGTCADIGFKVLYGIDTSEVSGIDALKNKGVPVLFVHGTADNWIDVENSEDMYAEAQKYAYSELWLVEGAEHAESRKVAGKEAYEDHIMNFLEAAGVADFDEYIEEAA